MKIKWAAILIAAICIIPVLNNCRSDKYVPGICFKRNILPIFVSKCSTSGCHDPISKQADYELYSYNGIIKGISPGHPLFSEIYGQIKGKNPSMPPQGHEPLTAQEVSYIKSWIQFGAKDEENCSVQCDVNAFEYKANVKPIIDSWCKGCHSSSNAGGGYDLSTYNGLVASITKNKLIGAINQQSGFSAMPKYTGKLSDCEIQVITQWVAAGHPNN
jgi:hypothetical protein